MKCKICDFDETSLKLKLPFFDLYYCQNCTSYFAGKKFSKSMLQSFYGENYFDFWKGTSNTLSDKVKEEVRVMKWETFAHYLKTLQKYTTFKNKKLLDVGCATGYLLEVARDKGCQVYGVELSPFAAKVAAKSFPKRIFCGNLEDSKFTKNSLDLITMIDLIEHVTDPIATLKFTKNILKPGGYLLIVTPNISSFWANLLGKKWTNYKEEHIFYFSPSSLDFLARVTGYQKIYEEPVTKYLTLEYIYSHFQSYPTPLLGTISKIFKLIPKRLRTIPFPIRTGDYLVILKSR